MSRNARTMGRMYASYGLSIHELAHDMGVSSDIVHVFNGDGAFGVARVAWDCTRDTWECTFMRDDYDPARDNMRPWINVVRFARAANEYARTPFACARVVDPDDVHARVVLRVEEDGNAESGPSVHMWFEVVDDFDNVGV